MNAKGLLWSEQLEFYGGVYGQKLCWFTAEGELVPTPEESAQKERQVSQQFQEANQKLQAQLEQMEAIVARYRSQFGELS